MCLGEKLAERENELTEKIVERQLKEGLKDLRSEKMKNVIIAYEPVWAIGTGKTATPDMAQETHAYIRATLNSAFGKIADDIPILYGGSVNGNNAAGLLHQPDIDGALVGGASLKADEFIEIVKSV